MQLQNFEKILRPKNGFFGPVEIPKKAELT
jgi:hypothetical protein